MIITLCVKDGTGAEDEALDRLNRWFTHGPHTPPYPPGSLLHYAITRDQESTGTDDDARTFLERANDAYLLRMRQAEPPARYQILADGIAWMDSDGREEWDEPEARTLAAMLESRSMGYRVELRQV